MEGSPSPEEGVSEVNKPVSELSDEELEKILHERKSNRVQQEREKFVSEKDAHKNEILQDLVPGMTVGEPKGNEGHSRDEEVVGIYDKDGKFIGNIVGGSGRFGNTPRNEFQDKAWELVAKSLGRDTMPEIKREAPEVNIDGGAKKIMGEMEVSLKGDTLYLFGGGKPEQIPLFGQGENQKIDIVKGKNELQLTVRVTEHRGKVIEYNINNGVFDFESRRVKLGGEDIEKEDKPKVEINMGSGVREMMARMWITLHDEKLNLQYGQMEIDLAHNGENEKVDLEKIDNDNILLRITEKGGRAIEYTINKGTFDADSRRVVGEK